MRTLIYARFSSALQNSRSIDQQVDVCRERAQREGWTVLDVFTDYAVSGGAGMGEGQRPGLAALLARVEEGGIEQVLVDTSSRIARHQGDAHSIRERLNYHGARLFTLGDGEIDRFKGAIKGLLDEQMRVELRHNIKRGQAGTVKQGRSPAGLAYGYRTANRIDANGRPVRGLRVIDEDQADILRRIFREYAAGISPRAIALQLNKEEVPGPRGTRWRATTIRPDRSRGNGMLSNRLYVGQLVHNRTSKVIDPVTRKTRIRPNPASDWVTEDVPHLRIIDDELWHRVQAELDGNRTANPVHKRRPRHFLSGLGKCGCCGASWNVKTANLWACGGNSEGAVCDNRRQITTENYERRVLEGLESRLLDPELVSIYVREYHKEFAKRAGESRRQSTRLETKKTDADRKVARLVAAIAQGGDEFPEIREALQQARADRDHAAAQLAEIEALPVVALHPGIADQYRQQVTKLNEALADPQARQEATSHLRALIDRIILTPAQHGRGVDVEVRGKLASIVALATGETPPSIEAEAPRKRHQL
ncbi:recombinase family protein [Croceicoccus sp. BE223]|uniref:recombinase family protein n=1 Tax=Croceicoccus sp. BE223 TaxID=2817716 RepID=UPI0028543785|nr:recombinase family protein [Croceicoccus sp. BE223]MDR7102955.1 DNA invertase Pin-like site-specific DNA recombinase [Croceicoccus sp. BE223]